MIHIRDIRSNEWHSTNIMTKCGRNLMELSTLDRVVASWSNVDEDTAFSRLCPDCRTVMEVTKRLG